MLSADGCEEAGNPRVFNAILRGVAAKETLIKLEMRSVKAKRKPWRILVQTPYRVNIEFTL